jgi:hypothetical protein
MPIKVMMEEGSTFEGKGEIDSRHVVSLVSLK